MSVASSFSGKMRKGAKDFDFHICLVSLSAIQNLRVIYTAVSVLRFLPQSLWLAIANQFQLAITNCNLRVFHFVQNLCKFNINVTVLGPSESERERESGGSKAISLHKNKIRPSDSKNVFFCVLSV